MNAHWRKRRRDVAGRPHRQSDDTSLGTAILTLIAGALLTVTTGLAVMFELEQFGPAVGGIVVFKPDTAATERWSVKAAVVDAHIGGCPMQPTADTAFSAQVSWPFVAAVLWSRHGA